MSKEENLLTLLKLFKNRPYHLAKFLLENNAIRSDFLKKIEKNSKLSEANASDIGDDHFYFTNISEMKAYYASLIEDLEAEGPDREKIKSDLEELIKRAVEIEDYEEAARIRDFMFLNKLK